MSRSERWPRATTAVAGIVGDPVAHSLSPVLHNAAFSAAGLDWVYVAFAVAESDRRGDWVRAIRALGLRGLSVTMPHKEAAARRADVRSAVVERLGAANTLFWVGDRLAAESTDGQGLLASLGEKGVGVAGRRVVVIGSGGAARAAILASASAGASFVGVLSRRREPAERAATVGGDACAVVSPADVVTADVVVNATPVGMAGGPDPSGTPVGRSWLRPDQVVVDLVYHPVDTPLLALAASVGARTVDGTGMLLHQAAAQFRLWTGAEPPLVAMRDALASALLERSPNRDPPRA